MKVTRWTPVVINSYNVRLVAGKVLFLLVLSWIVVANQHRQIMEETKSVMQERHMAINVLLHVKKDMKRHQALK
jgi:hypothetical protein